MAPKKLTSMMFIIMITMIVSPQTFAQEKLDKAQYKFYYEQLWQFDTLKNNDTREDLIILQVGPDISKSYSYYSFQSDSLRATPDGREIFRKSLRKAIDEAAVRGEIPRNLPYGKRMKTKVYKNHPEGKMTVTDGISTHYYIYVDELNSQSWHITDSAKTILDYSCQMAVSDFRGRRWIAWFASDIPVSDGPWKLSGLPGLIMEAYDTEKHYHFTIVGIEQVEDEPIVFSPVVLQSGSLGKHEETTRIDFYRGLARFMGNRSSYMNAELGRDTFDESTSSVPPHDFLERDY